MMDPKKFFQKTIASHGRRESWMIFVEDFAVKKGDIQALGVIAYGEPLLGATFVVAAGADSASWRLVAAAVLIVGGAVLGSQRLLYGQAEPSSRQN